MPQNLLHKTAVDDHKVDLDSAFEGQYGHMKHTTH